MRLYRVTNINYADKFDGRGSSYEDGARWNSAGHPVIYFALDIATALIEAANYHPSPRLLPPSHCKAIYTTRSAVSVTKLDLAELPQDWQEMPYPTSTQYIGDRFLESKQALLLLVPSVAVGISEYKIAVANPRHPDIRKIQLTETIQPVYSERMFQGL
jgi:RES domain-containing protein